MTAAAVLSRTARGYRDGEITWGRLFFNRYGCRCLNGGISWAVNPDDTAGDPRFVSDPIAALAAVNRLALYLVDAGMTPESFTDGVFDPVETVADWNDERGRTVAEVIAACEAAADVDEKAAAAR